MQENDPEKRIHAKRREIEENLIYRPWTVVRTWVHPLLHLADFEELREHPAEQEALEVFSDFTVCIWHQLDPSQVRSDDIGDLEGTEEVLRRWTVPWATNMILHPKLVPVAGNTRDAFMEKFPIFFPPTQTLRGGAWRHMEESYLTKYWKILQQKGEEERGKIEQALKLLFRHCQCLPHCTPRGPWKTAATGEIELIVNPGEYHADIMMDEAVVRRQSRKVTRTLKDFRKTIVRKVQSGLSGPDRRQVERNLGRQQGRRKIQKIQSEDDTDDDQPPRVHGNGWKRGRGGKRLGRPRKVQEIVTVKQKKRKDPLSDDSEYVPSDE